MTSSPYTHSELVEMLTHVQYELDMLVETSIALSDRHEWVIQNALVESFVVHARSLDEFFFNVDRRKKRNRVTAADYLHSRCTEKPSRPEVLRNLWNQASVRVAHLLIERLETDPDSTYWQIQGIRDALIDVAKAWGKDAKLNRFEIRVPHIEPATGSTVSPGL